MCPPNPERDFRCEYRGDILLYAANELSAGRKLELEEHLKGCIDCRDELESLADDIHSLRSSAAIADRGFDPAVARRILERVRQSRSRSRWSVLSLGAAVLLISGSVFLVISRRAQRDETVAARGQESPLERAMAWLRSAQETGGGWNPEKWGGSIELKVGVSGLVVLALERAGTLYGGETLERGLRYLLSQQQASGRFGPEFSGALYNHSIATLALLEAFARSKDESKRVAIDRALSFLISQQTRQGSWGGDAQPRNATGALSIWPVETLARARELGWESVAQPLERGFQWLDGIAFAPSRGSGAEGGLDGAAAPLYRAAAALLREGDRPPSRATRQAFDGLVKALAARPPAVDAHRSYFLSRLARSGVADRLRRPVEEARRSIESRQVAMGPLAGSWEPTDPVSGAGGRLSSTALAALTLEAAGRLR